MTMTTETQKLYDIRKQANQEIAEEEFAEAVKELKIKLRQAKWWHSLFPWQIIIRRRK